MQAGTMMLFWAYVVGVVLRATDDIKIWKLVVGASLVGDFLHLASFIPFGWEVYTAFGTWGQSEWGNIFLTYVGATFRAAFLLGIGLSRSGGKSKLG